MHAGWVLVCILVRSWIVRIIQANPGFLGLGWAAAQKIPESYPKAVRICYRPYYVSPFFTVGFTLCSQQNTTTLLLPQRYPMATIFPDGDFVVASTNILFEIFMELLGDADVVSDFVYYNSIKDNKNIKKDTRNAVYVFCIIGAIWFGFEKFVKCLTWKKTEEDKLYPLKFGCYATLIGEDFPMLVILLIIRKETGEIFNTQGKVSFWLGVISLFFKTKNCFYYVYFEEEIRLDFSTLLCNDTNERDIETRRKEGKIGGYLAATIFTTIIIVLFFALHPIL